MVVCWEWVAREGIKGWGRGNSKFQAPNPKQIPNSKHQIPNKNQNAKAKFKKIYKNLILEKCYILLFCN
jgi:hypothetical protein